MNILLTVTASSATIQLFGDIFLGVMTGILTVILLLFGEFYPKQIAITHCEQWVVAAAYPIYFFIYLFWPVAFVINCATGNISGKRTMRSRLTREHVLNQITVATRMGVLSQRTTHLLINAVDFEQESVREIMTHRTDVRSINPTTTVADALRIATEAGHSRFPVYENEEDNIIGIVHIKDALAAWAEDKKENSVRSLMRAPYFISQSRQLGTLLTDLRHRKIEMAIVLDEYGGLAGLVTITDLFEKIFGAFYDGHENIERPIIPQGNHTFQIRASIPIKEINRSLSLSIPNARGRQTLSGYLIHLCGSVPDTHQKIISPYGVFVVLSVTRRRIRNVLFQQTAVDEQAEH